MSRRQHLTLPELNNSWILLRQYAISLVTRETHTHVNKAMVCVMCLWLSVYRNHGRAATAALGMSPPLWTLASVLAFGGQPREHQPLAQGVGATEMTSPEGPGSILPSVLAAKATAFPNRSAGRELSCTEDLRASRLLPGHRTRLFTWFNR